MISSAEVAILKDFSSHDRHPVVSLYLNVDGAKFPTRADYETEFSILASNLRETAVRKNVRIINVPAGHPAMYQAGSIAARLRY